MHIPERFDTEFFHLTGNQPFPWQRKLFREFTAGKFRNSCSVPTGLGKTAIIAIWLLALTYHAHNQSLGRYPRRLVYVVNRRTVVDQATREAESMRGALTAKPELLELFNKLEGLQTQRADFPLAISTLRGQFADNAEWRDDPARPAVIVGTVDMIGSRLLFSGYGRGFKSRPLHAGFLGQDTLLVHDEAHLEPAFQELISAIEAEQRRCKEFGQFRVMELTATSRSAVSSDDPLFAEADRVHEEVKRRIEARKGVAWHAVEDGKKIGAKIVDLAKSYKESAQAILVFLREVEDVQRVADALRKEKLQVETLTGTLRGWERDALVSKNAIFARFMRNPKLPPQAGTVYLICTSAGEVGVDISADHLVCDLTPFDSMAQRFGRVNRFGTGDARIDIVSFQKSETNPEAATSADKDATLDAQSKKKEKPPSPYEHACQRTLSLLQQLPKREDSRQDGSPDALSHLPLADRQAAFTPHPTILPVSDILFDGWAMTAIRGKLPGRPPVADWLHGVAEWEPPETHVAWREEVGLITPDLVPKYPPEDLLEDFPLKPHELLRDRTTRVFSHLERIAARCADLAVWVVDTDNQVDIVPVERLIERDKQNKPVMDLANCTVILPPGAGGLSSGLLDGEAIFDEKAGADYDIADLWLDAGGNSRRCRVWDGILPAPAGMRLVRTIDIGTTAEDEDDQIGVFKIRYWRWFVRPRAADDDGSRTARVKQELEPHLRTAEDFAKKLVGKLGLNEQEAKAVILASRWHDLGKDRSLWQRSIGNMEYPSVKLAKSDPRTRPLDFTRYRHEFGSLIDVSGLIEFQELAPAVQELVLHFIAAHHGRARPNFSAEESFDPSAFDHVIAKLAQEIPGRFARLQRKYGRWGLAYLESLIRAADAMASQADTDGNPVDDPSVSHKGGNQ